MRPRAPSPSGPGPGARAGFSLLELILVLVVVAVVSGIAIPAHFNRPEITLENAAILLANDLRRAQNRAAHLGETVEVTFDSRVHGYRIWQATRETPLQADGDEEAQTSYARRYSRDAVFEGVRVEKALFGGSPALRFGPFGAVEAAGEVHLRYRGALRVVEVEAPTGRLTILGSSSGWTDRGF